jgi:hypothetical protein
MKFLTETKEGGRIVEMSHDEIRAFRRLVMAVEGEELIEVFGGYFADDWQHFFKAEHPDMSKTFDVIAAWITQKCNLNEMEHAVSAFKVAIGEKG